MFRRRTTTEENPVTSVEFLADGVTVAPAKPTAESELEQLRAQRADIEYRAEVDNLSRAADPAEWRVRDAERRGQLAEIEVRVRRLEAWRELAQSHEEPVRAYEEVSRLVQARNRYLFDHARWVDASGANHGAGDANRDLHQWWEALGTLARSLPSNDDTARASLVRELNAWLRARNAFCAAALAESGRGNPPWPELHETFGLPDALPAWVHIGAARGDR